MQPPWPVRTFTFAARSRSEAIPPFLRLSVRTYRGVVSSSSPGRSANRIAGVGFGFGFGFGLGFGFFGFGFFFAAGGFGFGGAASPPQVAAEEVGASSRATSAPDPKTRRGRPRIRRGYTRSLAP